MCALFFILHILSPCFNAWGNLLVWIVHPVTEILVAASLFLLNGCVCVCVRTWSTAHGGRQMGDSESLCGLCVSPSMFVNIRAVSDCVCMWKKTSVLCEGLHVCSFNCNDVPSSKWLLEYCPTYAFYWPVPKIKTKGDVIQDITNAPFCRKTK